MKPFLKWAGGKNQLLLELEKNFPNHIKKSRGKNKVYVEMFVGAGALFFYVAENYDFDEYILNDSNSKLINIYRVIKSDVEGLIKTLEKIKRSYLKLDESGQEEKFYEIRKEFNSNLKDKILEAAYFIFLNKTNFNGLYRENSKGEFNVPWGQTKKNPCIYDGETLRKISKFLNKKNSSGKSIVTIYNKDFSSMAKTLLKHLAGKSFVYLDPPYRPVTKSGFNSYTKSSFTDVEQIKLAEVCKRFHRRCADLLLSNSDPKVLDEQDNFFDDLYSAKYFHIQRVGATRMINSDSNNRGAITEILVKNY
ncbi:MAG: DNA adenine methylase [Fusobacteriaceae bacterium]